MTLTKIGLTFLSCGISATSLLTAQAASTSEETARRVEIAAANAEDAAIVDCQLPGKLVKLGGMRTYLTPGALTRLAAIDCRVRGGEYTLGDLSSGTFSLQRWLPLAELGNAEAQYYVARIHANGMSGVPVDYAAAAQWYERAAKQNFASAQTELGYLYEKGLGVDQDLKLALDLQRKGAGLGEELDYAWKIGAARDEAERQMSELSARLESSNAEIEDLRVELGQSRDSLAESHSRLARSQTAVAQLNADLVAARQAGTGADPERIRALEASLDSRTTELRASAERIAQLEADVTTRQTQLTTSFTNSQATNAQLNELRTALKTANAQVNDLRGQVEQAQLRLASSSEDLSRERAQYRKDVDTLVAKHQKAVDALHAKPAQPQNSAEADNLARQLAAARVELGARQRRIASLETETDMQREQVKRLLDRSTGELASSRNESKRLRGELEGARDMLEKAETDAAGMRAALLESRTRLASESRQGQVRQQQVAALQIQVKDQEEKLKLNEKQIAELRRLAYAGPSTQPAVASMPASISRPVPKVDPKIAQRIAMAKNLDKGNYYALVIGNSNYERMGRLDSAVGDAKAVAEVLERNYNFKVQLLTDATRERIVMALNDWTRKLGENDSFFVYYAGHGESTGPGRESWLGVEADTTGNGFLDSDNVRAQIQQMQAKRVLVVADCCLAGGVTHTKTTTLGREMDERAFEIRFQKKARMVLTSGQASGTSGSDRDHSVFAEYFLRVLRENQLVMSGEMLACELGERLRLVSGQQKARTSPIYSALLGADHAQGDFFFVPAPVERLAFAT